MDLVRLRDVSFALTNPPLLSHANLTIHAQERIALVGRNGAGKSTLLRILMREITPDSGVVDSKPGLNVTFLQQSVSLEDTNLTVFECVAKGLPHLAQALNKWHHAQIAVSTDSSAANLKSMEEAQHEMDNADGWLYQSKIEAILSEFGLDGERHMSTLSGGFTRRVLLAKALVSNPDLLLLDEPTNHLDIPSVEWLETRLKNTNTCLLFVSHDRRFIQNIATRILDLDRGHLSSWNGDYHNYLRRKEEQLHAQALEAERLAKKLDEEEVWIRQGIKARRTRNEGRVRALLKLRQESQAQIKATGMIDLDAHTVSQSGKLVIEAEHVCYAPLTIKDFSYTIARGDKIGIVGPNGIGKTTLVKLLLQTLQPTSGTVRHGARVHVALLDQLRNTIDLNQTVRDYVGQGSDQVVVSGKARHVMSWLKDFLFSAQQINTKLAQLSGGERARAMLARILTTDTNLLVMDEPTNDLDIETLEFLEAWLVDYPGTLILVSHDRDFLNNTVTRLIAFDEQGDIITFTGGYDEWAEYRQRRQTKASAKTASEKPATVAAQKSNQPRPKKLSFNEQKELEQLPGIIETLETSINQLNQTLAEPALYKDQPDQVEHFTQMLHQKQQALEQSYQRWEYLEALKNR